MIPHNILTCQSIVKALPTSHETFNTLVNRITIHGIVITITYFPCFIFIYLYFYFYIFLLLFIIFISVLIYWMCAPSDLFKIHTGAPGFTPAAPIYTPSYLTPLALLAVAVDDLHV
jgi:hypothetical protein